MLPPVFPDFAINWPALTDPDLTTKLSRCIYRVTIPLSCWMLMILPPPPLSQPARMIFPSRAAYTLLFIGVPISMPLCNFRTPVIGWIRQPKGEVIRVILSSVGQAILPATGLISTSPHQAHGLHLPLL